MTNELRFKRSEFESNEFICKDVKQWILDNTMQSDDKDEFIIRKEKRIIEAGVASFNRLKLFALSNGISENDIKIENNKLVLPYISTSVSLTTHVGDRTYFSKFTIRNNSIVFMELAVSATIQGKKIILPSTLQTLTIIDNSPIDNIVLPRMLDRLEFYHEFNQPIDKLNWEEVSLSELAFCNRDNDYKNFEQSSFNQPIICLVKRLKNKLTFFGLNATVSKDIQEQINTKLMAPRKEVQVNYWSYWDNKPHKQQRKYTCTLDDIYL